MPRRPGPWLRGVFIIKQFHPFFFSRLEKLFKSGKNAFHVLVVMYKLPDLLPTSKRPGISLRILGRFFKDNLATQLRLGAIYLGERNRPVPYYAPYSPNIETLNPAVTPYLHANFFIKDVVLFVALQNPLGLEYERVYRYAMPQTQLRWGLSWRFFN